MGAIKILLVVLLCVPIAFILWYFFNNLIVSISKQQSEAERIRRNKSMFQETYLEKNSNAPMKKKLETKSNKSGRRSRK